MIMHPMKKTNLIDFICEGKNSYFNISIHSELVLWKMKG